MTRREKLQENFEDALFALLMEEVAEQEGQRLLEENEKLKRDPESTVPPEVDRRCLKTIRRAFAKTQRRAAGHTAYRVFRQAAMVAVVGMLLFVTSNISKVPLAKLSKSIWPFVAAAIVVVLLLTFIPQLVMFIPNWLSPA